MTFPLLKGEFILSGSLVPLEPAIAGDSFSIRTQRVLEPVKLILSNYGVKSNVQLLDLEI